LRLTQKQLLNAHPISPSLYITAEQAKEIFPVITTGNLSLQEFQAGFAR
jgi:hypothetical protein